MAEKPSPIPLSMVICDTVIEDKITGKKSLIGLFNNINARKVPAVHPSLSVYISLTEGVGSYDGKLRCIFGNKPIIELGGPIVFKSPHQIAEWNFSIRGLPLPSYGEYRFELLCDGKLVIARKFKVIPIKQ